MATKISTTEIELGSITYSGVTSTTPASNVVSRDYAYVRNVTSTSAEVVFTRKYWYVNPYSYSWTQSSYTWGTGGGVYAAYFNGASDPGAWTEQNVGTYSVETTTYPAYSTNYLFEKSQTFTITLTNGYWEGWIQFWDVYNYCGLNKSNTMGSYNIYVQEFSAPSGLSVSILEKYPTGAKFSVSIDSYGRPSDAAGRYIEAGITTTNAYPASPYRYSTAMEVTSAEITVSNASGSSSPALTIYPNTQYYYGGYAWNTQLATYQSFGSFVTLPPQDTLSLNTAHSSSLDIDYSVPADGGALTKTLEYSIDGGTTWVTYDTISGGSATTGSFTITGLSAGTTYTISSRVTTTAGTTLNADIIGRTIGPEKPIVSVQVDSDTQITITYKETAFNSQAGRDLQLYGDTSSTPTTLLTTQSSPTDNTEYTYIHTPLASNQRYYYRALAHADFDGVSVPSEYSDEVFAWTFPPKPTIADITWVEYPTAITQKYSVTISVPSDAGALPKDVEYRITVNGTTSEWDWLQTVSSGDATTFTANIVVTNATATQYTGTLEIRSTSAAGPSLVDSQTFIVKANAGAPTVSNWDLVDANSAVSSVLGTSEVFIEGYSLPKFSVNQSDITLAEGASIAQITGTFGGITQNLTLDSGVYSTIFSTPTSGEKIGTFFIKDNLDGEYIDSVSRTVLAYSEPTITGNYSYVSEDGKIGISIAGEFAPFIVDNVDKNILTVSYKVSSDTTLVDWTNVQVEKNGTDYTAYINNVPTNFNDTYLVELKIVDALGNLATYSFEVSALDKERFLATPQYDIEVWTRDGDFVADISKYLTTDLSITWKLNDVEELSFSISLDALELLRQNGVSTIDLLTPYAHDIRVRRNGEYIVGCQVVEANVKVDNDQIPTVEVKATGFLNIFKDQYISEPMAGYTYPEMAHKLINRAQHADCLVKNPTGDIDASYWLSDTSSVAQTTVSYAGAGAIQASASSSPTTLSTQLNVRSGTLISVNVWVSGAIGTVNVYERELINQSSNQVLIGSLSLTSAGTYTQLVVNSYTTSFDNGYIYFSEAQTGTPLRIDNCFVSRIDDEDSLNNHYVGCIYSGLDDTTGGTGHNYATSGYTDREFNYELQNVKDAIMDLTQMGEDYFEFEFTPDRIFNTYDRKGSDRTDIEIMYPGNVHSMTVERSAADLANKIQEIGSGIGDERLEVVLSNYDSRLLYGTRESAVTQNNVSLEETLEGLAQGELDERSELIPVISVQIQDGSINCGNVQTGDVLAVRIGDYLGVLGQQQNLSTRIHLELLGGVEGWYRVKQIQARVAQDGGEALTLKLEYVGGFEES